MAAKHKDVEELATRLITAHSATVEWLTTVLAEDALGGPAALRRTPMQAAAGLAVKFVNLPLTWSTAASSAPPRPSVRCDRPSPISSIVVHEPATSPPRRWRVRVTRRWRPPSASPANRAPTDAADAIHAARGATGILEPAELPIADYDDLNVNEAVTAIKDLTDPTDIRVIVAYEEANKNGRAWSPRRRPALPPSRRKWWVSADRRCFSEPARVIHTRAGFGVSRAARGRASPRWSRSVVPV